MKPTLELPNGESILVANDLVIGRTRPAEIVVKDDKVSRRHAKLIFEGGVAEIEDLGSRNGTTVNGQSVTRRMLRDGDEVKVGSSVLVYRESAPAVAAPEPEPVAEEAPVADDVGEELDFEDEITFEEPAAPAPRSDVEVLEFEDEVVEVQKPAARPAAAAAARAPTQRKADPRVPLQQRSQRGDGGGVFGQDVSQLGGTPRLLMTLLAVAIAGGIGYLAFTAAS